MKCSKAKKWINNYVDGELEAKQTSALKEHFRTCAGCRHFLEDFQKIRETAAGLESIDPPDVGWAEIEKELAPGFHKKQKNNHWIFPDFFLYSSRPVKAFGAALLLVIVIGALTFGPKIIQKSGAAGNQNNRLVLSKLDEAEHYYQKAIQSLGEALAAGRKDMDPGILKVFRDNLTLINASLSACKEAVLNNPKDVESRQYLLAMYREKTDLLSQWVEQGNETAPSGEHKTII